MQATKTTTTTINMYAQIKNQGKKSECLLGTIVT